MRPILSDNCFLCHGPDKNARKANFRLDLRDEALAQRDDRRAIVPGDIAASALVARITSDDPNEMMPPPESERALSDEQKQALIRWIQEGAEYQPHWAYITPVRPAPPETGSEWPRHPIDEFIFAKLTRNGVAPSPEADRRALIRRLSFDLTGIPPTPDEVDAFVADTRPEAYEELVDRLLASPRFGERMALHWLDLVRYADTNGYHGDEFRSVWLYRDYVIDAFNANMPFDRFTIEQIGGDLLPQATRDQKIASGYNRLNQITAEGGAQPKEYIAIYAADRVRTTSAVWMGATLGCAQCHDHKFDPYTIDDFYKFSSFFADVEETPVYGAGDKWEPYMAVPTPEQESELARLDRELNDLRARIATDSDELHAQEIGEILSVASDARSDEQRARLDEYFREVAPERAEVWRAIQEREEARQELVAEIPTTLITVSVEPRVTRVLPRGNWLDESGAIVEPDTPPFLPPLDVTDRRATRLDLAQWLVDENNPTTARVFVNRMWKLFFGTGISKVLDDLGGQGEWPTHPDLLDWLAVEFRESGWDVKHIVKTIVTSSTYRQSSGVSDELFQADPYNRLLARQSRFRLNAEMVRDNALAVSGLLHESFGGPGVFPYQPDGYWDNCNTFTGPLIYTASTGEDQHRRGLYTIWKRSFLHPSILAFDAPTREECTAERVISNNPLQALVLLNDPTYVEAARAFAERMLVEGGLTAESRIQWAFRRALNRAATADELRLLADLYGKHKAGYVANPADAVKLVHIGQLAVPETRDKAELAAWMSVARVILNLHETITRT